MLINVQTQNLSISYPGCLSQVYFYMIFGCVANLLLTVMAYDRYMAICHPLYYTTVTREGLYALLEAGFWILSCAGDLIHTLLLAQGSFCADNIIPNFSVAFQTYSSSLTQTPLSVTW